MKVELKFSEKDLRRFLDKILLCDTDGLFCHYWIGSKSKKGYGYFSHQGKVKKAHRVSYEIHKGEIPEDMHVLHSCNNPSCVNPKHLFLGTNKENYQDKLMKNRQYRPPKKFTEEELVYIRKYPRYWGSLSDLAREFNCATSTMYYARENKKCR